MKKLIYIALVLFSVNSVSSQEIFEIPSIKSLEAHNKKLKYLQSKLEPVFDTIHIKPKEKIEATNFFSNIMEGNYDFVNKEIHKPIISKIFKRNNYNKSDFLNLTIAISLLQYQWYNYAWKNNLEYQGGNHLAFDCSKRK